MIGLDWRGHRWLPLRWSRPFDWHLQPIVALRPGIPAPVAAELLYRGPALGRSLRRWRRWYQQVGELVPALIDAHELDRIQVNVDANQLCDPQVHASLAHLPGQAAIEWIEHPLRPGRGMSFETVIDALYALRECGLAVVFDDVGSGEDSLQRLAALEPDEIKLDGHLLWAARANLRVRSHLRSLVASYHEQGVLVTIEYIETAADRTTAEAIGADRGQGFLWEGPSRLAPHA